MKKVFILPMAILFTTFMVSCKTSEKTNIQEKPIPVLEKNNKITDLTGSQISSPRVFVYKMKKDYSNNVPVIMDAGHTKIVSYPAPADLKRGNGYATPTKLKDGFWLDNKGIGPNVAFLSYTYEEYSNLKQAPTMEELMNSIIDKNPLSYHAFCGRRNDYKDIVNEINQLIESGRIYSMGPTVCPEPMDKAE